MRLMKIVPLVLITMALCIFTSCSPVLKVAVADSGDIVYSVESSVSPLIEETVRSFTGAHQSLPLFNEEQILQALRSAGLRSVGVDTPDNSSLIVSARIESAVTDKMGTIPSLGSGSVCQDMVPQVAGAIGYCHSSQVGQRKLVLTISPDVLRQVMGIVPAETAEYMDLLSAPILTGEAMTAVEYADLIGVIYGDSVAKELRQATVRILVTAPAEVQSATVSVPAGRVRTQGRYVEFSLPLPELLSYLGKIEFTVQY
ncbi:MAG: hypothetical protein IJC31_03040 [Spirochaetaceae bacterium]|nr:hypothetical protein [Spirochaetaceae bacterium]